MNVNTFIDLQKTVMTKQGIDNYVKPDIKKIKFKNKIAEDDNIPKIQMILQNNTGREVLLMAGTGTGKTYVVNEIIDKTYADEWANKSPRKSIHILLTPSRAQTCQLEQEYKFRSIVGGVSSGQIKRMQMETNKLDLNFQSTTKLSCVYDKAYDISMYIRLHPEYDFHLYVDEAHKLCTAYGYRDEAINDVEELIELVKEKNGYVCLMTATPQSLIFRKEISSIIECSGEEKVAKYNEIEIVCKSNPRDSIEDMVYSTIVTEVEAGNRCFVRYNSFADTGNISSKLRVVKKFTVNVVSSKNKDYKVMEDFEGNKFIEYENPIYNCVINNSSLPKADVWFTSSMLDEGNNISKIEKVGQDENIVTIFVVKDMRHMLLDDLLQFSARIRFSYKKFIIILNKSEDENEPIKDLGNICWGINKQVQLTKQIVNMYIEIMKLQSRDIVKIKKELDQFTQIENISGFRNNMDCIHIDSNLEVQIDDRQKELHVYNAYNNQYANNINDFYEFLQKETDCKNISVIEAQIKNDIFYPTDILERALWNDRMLQQIFDNRLTDDSLVMIKHTKEYKQVKDFIKIAKLIYKTPSEKNMVAKKAVSAVVEGFYKEDKQQLISTIVKKMLPEEIKQVVTSKCNFGWLWDVKELFEKEGIIAAINGLDTMLGLDKAVEQFKKLEGDVCKINNYIKNNFEAYMNELYLTDRDKLWGLDKAGRAHAIILDNIYEVNAKGVMKKKTLNDKLLIQVTNKLNNEFGEGAFTERKVKNRIKKMFVMQDGNKIAYLKKVKR